MGVPARLHGRAAADHARQIDASGAPPTRRHEFALRTARGHVAARGCAATELARRRAATRSERKT